MRCDRSAFKEFYVVPPIHCTPLSELQLGAARAEPAAPRENGWGSPPAPPLPHPQGEEEGAVARCPSLASHIRTPPPPCQPQWDRYFAWRQAHILSIIKPEQHLPPQLAAPLHGFCCC